MKPDKTIAYVYDGSFGGFLSAVFMAFKTREEPASISLEENLQICFGQEIRRIETSQAMAARVENGIRTKIGEHAWKNIWTAFLSCEPDKDTAVWRYIRTGFDIGRRIHTHLSHEDVMAVEKMLINIGYEQNHLMGFARFALLDNGVYYSRITPKNNLVPLLMPHFSDRFRDQPLLLFDPGHAVAGVYDLEKWYLVETDVALTGERNSDEAQWQSLWKSFYDTIAIQERVNPKLRRNHMPKRFWPNMPEMGGAVR